MRGRWPNALPAASTTNSTSSPVITCRTRGAHTQWRPSRSRCRARESSVRGSRCSCVFIVLQACQRLPPALRTEECDTAAPQGRGTRFDMRYPYSPGCKRPARLSRPASTISRAISVSRPAARQAASWRAMIVSAGLALPWVGSALPSVTNRFGTSQQRWSLSTTLVSGTPPSGSRRSDGRSSRC